MNATQAKKSSNNYNAIAAEKLMVEIYSAIEDSAKFGNNSLCFNLSHIKTKYGLIDYIVSELQSKQYITVYKDGHYDPKEYNDWKETNTLHISW